MKISKNDKEALIECGVYTVTSACTNLFLSNTIGLASWTGWYSELGKVGKIAYTIGKQAVIAYASHKVAMHSVDVYKSIRQVCLLKRTCEKYGISLQDILSCTVELEDTDWLVETVENIEGAEDGGESEHED